MLHVDAGGGGEPAGAPRHRARALRGRRAAVAGRLPPDGGPRRPRRRLQRRSVLPVFAQLLTLTIYSNHMRYEKNIREKARYSIPEKF